MLQAEVAKFIERKAPGGHPVTIQPIANPSSILHMSEEHPSRAARIAIKLLARKTEVGARTLVHGASAGPKSHGQYVPDCKITPTEGLTDGQEGVELQERVGVELKEKLEAVRVAVMGLG